MSRFLDISSNPDYETMGKNELIDEAHDQLQSSAAALNDTKNLDAAFLQRGLGDHQLPVPAVTERDG